ncbi:MAG: TrbI/VirB10 family protein [Rickettsiales bacterium]|jgi:type IV secretory pathway VirB10-like protein|nr:TrbI/VirB10 family protein [Rickettsiales bacterium]
MADNSRVIDPVVIDEEPVVDVDNDPKNGSSGGVGGNAKYVTIGVSVAISVLIYFFVFSGGKKEDIVDPNQIVVDDKAGNTNTRSTIDNIDSIIGSGGAIDYTDSYVNNSERNLLELPELPKLPDNIGNEIEKEIQETKRAGTDGNTFSKNEVDELINVKLKSFEQEMSRIKNESEKLAKELEKRKLEEEEEKKKKKFASILGGGSSVVAPNATGSGASGVPPELTSNDDIMTTEERKAQEEREMKIAQRARIMEERKSSPMFKMQGGGGGDGKEEEKDSIIVLDKDSLQQVKEEVAAVVTTKNSDLARVINQGKVIAVVLETAINTDVQAQVRAVVSRDIYSQLGKNILIPKGSRLVGSFQNISSVGISRLGITWTKIIRSDGLNISINSGSSDNLGRGGIEGELDNKYVQAMRNAFLSSMITVASAALVDKVTDTVSTTVTNTGVSGTSTTSTTNATNEAIIDATKSFTDEMQSIVDNLKEEKPTIRIAQGTKINVIVNQDLTLPIYKQKNKKI